MNRFKADRLKLKHKNCKLFDATFMYKLIPEVCEGLETIGTTAWILNDETQLECCLKQLKDFRNEVAHEPKGAAIRPGLLNDVLRVAVKALGLAGSLFNIEPDIVKKSIEDLEENVENITDTMMTDKEKRMKQVEKRIMIDGKNEMRSKLREKDMMMSLPFTETKVISKNVFYMTKLRIENDEEPKVISSKELFQTITSRYCFIQGQPGSGKSTLLRRMVEDFFEENLTEAFSGIRNYAFMLFFECRDRVMSNCFNLVQQAIPNTLENLEQEEALEILRKLPCLLLIDGIDEITKNSRLVVEDLISNFGDHGTSTFVITSRVGDEMEKLKSDLSKKNIDYAVIAIEPISDRDEQIQFLENFADDMQGVTASKLTSAFNSLTQSCFVHFEYPLYLALFCQLYHSSSHDAEMWEDECSIMKQTVKLSISMIEDRLQSQQVSDWKNVSRQLMDAAGKLSLNLLIQDKLTIKMSEYIETCGNWFENHDVPYETVLSCIFLPTSEFDTYEYLHKSQAEFLAAHTLLTQLRNNPDYSISKQIEDIENRAKSSNDSERGANRAKDRFVTKFSKWMREFFSQSLPKVQRQRFLNVIRFVVMELVTEGHNRLLTRCLKELTQITNTFRDEKVNIEFWAELSLSCPNSDQVALTAIKAVNASVPSIPRNNWTVTNQKEMTTAIFSLRKKIPDKLTVKLSQGTNTNPALVPMIGVVEKYYKNDLRLLLEKSYFRFESNDNVLTRLSVSKCKLTQFTGCITSKTAQTALIKAVRRVKNGLTMDFSISTTSPRQHKLAELEGMNHKLSFRTKLSEDCTDSSPRPLPKGTVAPRLTVVLEDRYQSHAELVKLIEDLAPSDKKYMCLYIEGWEDSASSLDELIKSLSSSAVRTNSNQTEMKPMWKEIKNTTLRNCRVCGTKYHKPDVAQCMQLIIPLSEEERQSIRLSSGNVSEASASNTSQRSSRSGHLPMGIEGLWSSPKKLNSTRLRSASNTRQKNRKKDNLPMGIEGLW